MLTAMAKFCEECGRPLREGAQFCGSCGHPVASAAGSASAEGAGGAPAEGAGGASAGGAGGAPAGGAGGGGAGGGGRNQKLLLGLLALLALLVVAIGAVAVALFVGGGDDEPSKADREVLLESAASAGPAPFTPDIQPVAATVPTTLAPATTLPPAPSGRTAQGPFGGTGDNSLCDRELLIDYLTDPANAAVAREWARVLDVQVADIPAYVRALIPTTLTADARVTNHRWENGRAVGYQAVLERGTAVLVDTDGRLIARCRCGNPLLPPQEISKPVYTGPKWEGFDPTVIVVVVPSPTPIYPPGGVGTLPATTPTTRRPSSTAVGNEADEAIRRIREPFEACVRATNEPAASEPFFTPAELEQLIASVRYEATLIDQRTGTYRVVVTVPSQDLSAGEVTGDYGTWEVNLRDGTITPVDANAQDAAASCPGLG